MADAATPARPAPAESSTATIEIPRETQAYANWRQTGEIPDATKTAKPAQPKPDSTPGKTSETAPAPEAGSRQEHKRSDAAQRLEEILADLKTAGYTPAELKQLRREAKKDTPAPAAAPPEKTAQPAGNDTDSQAPKKPKLEDFEDLDKFEEARDKYFGDLADYRAETKFREYQQREAQQKAATALNEKIATARQRYGDEADTHIKTAASAIFSDAKVPQAIKALVDQSPVLVDLMYVLGSKPEDLAGFVEIAKSDPGAAIRKLVLLEQLVTEELKKPSKASEGEGTNGEAERDPDTGKFLKRTPEKHKPESETPAPPKEVSGRGTPPADPGDKAVKDNDFASFRAAQNRRDLEQRRGR